MLENLKEMFTPNLRRLKEKSKFKEDFPLCNYFCMPHFSPDVCRNCCIFLIQAARTYSLIQNNHFEYNQKKHCKKFNFPSTAEDLCVLHK